MGTLYIECNMGAAGDMLMAALLELVDDPKAFLDRLNAAGIPGAAVTAKSTTRCGITGTCVSVMVDGREECGDPGRHGSQRHDDNHYHDDSHDHDHHHKHHTEHHHRSRGDIEHIINRLNVSDGVKKNTLAVYTLIAEAESRVHGVTIDKIHFHEVGETDAVADIVGVCMLIEELAPEAVVSSPINTGSGHVRCAHGTLPVPAPATAHILQGIPVYNDGSTKSELCTPTGAALLKHFAKKFSSMPAMTVRKTGYGMGKKEFERANCVRAYLGDITGNNAGDNVTELSCNLDDMTPEAVSFAQETLLREGALDAWVTSAGMKKGRIGAVLTCLCGSDIKDKMVSLIFKHTTTLGIREYICRRYTLQRESTEVQTQYGPIKIKKAQGYGIRKSKPEYEDAARIAREKDISIDDVLNAVN